MESSGAADQRQNLLEWLKGRGFPDAVLTFFVYIFFGVLTFTPYLSGRTLWLIGSSPVTVPNISANWFWITVFISPFFWSILTIRLIHASLLKIITTFIFTACLSLAIVTLHKLHPGIALGSIAPNFDHTYNIEFLKTQQTWKVAHISKPPKGNRYNYFRTNPIPLVDDIVSGSALRINEIEIEFTGYGSFDKEQVGFDIETYVGTTKMEPMIHADISADDWQKEMAKPVIGGMTDKNKGVDITIGPQNAEVIGKVVITAKKIEIGSNGHMQRKLMFDFSKDSFEVVPTGSWLKQITRKDIYVIKEAPKLQLVGWTLSGDDCSFDLVSISVRVKGSSLSGFWF